MIGILLAAMAVHVVAVEYRQRRAAIEALQARIQERAKLATLEQQRILAGAKSLLEAVAAMPEVARPAGAACGRELAKLLRGRPQFKNIGIADLSGDILCSAVPLGRPVNAAESPWFRRAIATGDFVLGLYAVGRSSEMPSLNLALPVRGQDGKIGAVIVAAVDLAWLGDGLGATLLPEGSVLYLIQQDGTLLVRHPAMAGTVGSNLRGTALYAAMEKHGFAGDFSAIGPDGTTWLYHAFTLQPGEGVSAGYAVIGTPTAAVFGAIDKQLERELVELAVLGAILLALGYFLSDAFILRPVAALTRMSREIAAGNRAVRSGLAGRSGEIGRLAASMDQMAAAIAHYEEQLARRQAQLAEAQEIARLCSWRWSLTGGGMELSNTGCSILGLPPAPAKISYETLHTGVHPDDLERIDSAVAQAIQARSGYAVEYRARGPGGDLRHIWERGRCEADADGTVVALSGVVLDVTALKQAEQERQQAVEALRRSEEQFRSAIANSPIGMAVVEPDGKCLMVNEALCTILKDTESNLLAGRLPSMTDPGGEEIDLDKLAQALYPMHDNLQVETRIARRDESKIWVLLSISLVRDNETVPRYLIIQFQDISEQVAVRAALEASEERYRRLLEAVPDAVAVHRDGRLEMANAALPRLLGAETAEDVIGRRFIDFIQPEHRPAALNALRQVQAGHDTGLIEFVVQRPDGSAVYLEATSSSFSDVGSRSVVTIMRDISKRREAEQALRNSEQELRLIADNLPILLTRLDRDGRHLFLNTEGEARYGLRRAEVLGRSLSDLLGDREYRKIRPYLDLALMGERQAFATTLDYPDGTTRDVECLYIPDFTPDGTVRGAFAVTIDVTERRLAEAALRDSERRFRHLVESMNIVPYSLDIAEGRYTYLGPQAERLLGHRTELWQDLPSWIWHIHAEDQERVREHSRRLAAEPGDTQIEYRIVKPDGRVLWVNDVVKVEAGEDGRQVGFGVIIDVTDSRLRDHQLQQAQKMEAIGQLTGGIAHDFNNMLTVITVNLDLVAMALDEDSELRGRIEPALLAAQQGSELTQRLLAFARRQVLRPMIVDVNALIPRFFDMVSRTLGETIRIEMDLGAELWPVLVDRSGLEAVLLNLAVNSRDAMPAGGILTIATANFRHEKHAPAAPEFKVGDYAMLAVSDTGAGMPADVQRRAFEPFFTTKEVGKGTGLGLSMVYGFVKQSGGYVYIDSNEGRGTTVRIYLPRMTAKAAEAALEPATPAQLPNGGKTILLVEDDAAVRASVRALLGNLGYRVLEAQDGRSAMKLARRHAEIDMVITDVIMPGGMNGPDLARHILRHRPDVKLLYLSGYVDDPALRDGALGTGAALLSKPFHGDELARKISDAFCSRGGAPAGSFPIDA